MPRLNFNSKLKGYVDVLTIIYIAIVIVFCISLLVSCAHSVDKTFDTYTITATVTDKTVKRSDGTDKYLIFTETENGEVAVFEITDNFLVGRFDSSNAYAEIKVGETYNFTVGGQRNEFMSWYPNIYEYEKIDKEE